MRVLACMLMFVLVGCAGPARSEPAVWMVEDSDSTILLFGSFHLLPPGASWRPEALDAALARADDVWFEIPVEDAVNPASQRQAAARAILPAGRSLSSMLSEEGARRLALVAAEAGLSMMIMDRMQPWFAETTLGLAVYRQQGALPEEGVEHQIARAAPPGARRVALETTAHQIDVLASAPEAEQVASLEHSLRLFETDPGYFRRILRLWLEGDAEGLNREVVEEMRRISPGQYRTLIVDRNRAWVPRIRERLAGSGHTVIVVGAGHLVGPDSVPAMLRAQGVPVRGP